VVKRAALIFVAASSPLILLSFFLPEPAGPLAFTVLAVAFPVALIGLGAARNGRLGPLAAPLLVLLLLLEGCVVGMLVLRGKVLETPWLGGLPLPAAIQIYAMWLLPLGLIALAYALTFDRFSLTEADLRRLRREFGSDPGEA
jgi:hypothetical protein